MIYGYKYTDPDGSSYTGKIATDPTDSKYNYQPGQTYPGPNGGSYTIDAGAGTQSTIPAGRVMISNYTDYTGKTYDNYVYDPKTNNYYTASTTPYNSADWRYYPNSADTTNSINFAPAKLGLGSEYGYIKADNGTYHPYGRGGYAHATITPATLQVYDYKFTFTDGSYYTGKVVDDGTFGYKAGYTQPGYSTDANNPTDPNKLAGNYAITAAEPATAVLPTYKAGEVYGQLYHDAVSNADYQPASLMPGTPYADKAEGYGGLGTEVDWVQWQDGYHKYGGGGAYEASSSPAVAAIPNGRLPI
jgi:hypothetical protein